MAARGRRRRWCEGERGAKEAVGVFGKQRESRRERPLRRRAGEVDSTDDSRRDE